MKQEDAGVIPVTENGRLTGMVTDRDIAIRVVAEDRPGRRGNLPVGGLYGELPIQR